MELQDLAVIVLAEPLDIVERGFIPVAEFFRPFDPVHAPLTLLPEPYAVKGS